MGGWDAAAALRSRCLSRQSVPTNKTSPMPQRPRSPSLPVPSKSIAHLPVSSQQACQPVARHRYPFVACPRHPGCRCCLWHLLFSVDARGFPLVITTAQHQGYDSERSNIDDGGDDGREKLDSAYRRSDGDRAESLRLSRDKTLHWTGKGGTQQSPKSTSNPDPPGPPLLPVVVPSFLLLSPTSRHLAVAHQPAVAACGSSVPARSCLD